MTQTSPHSLSGDIWTVRPITARERLQFGQALRWTVLRNTRAVHFYATLPLAELHVDLGNSAAQAASGLSMSEMLAHTREATP